MRELGRLVAEALDYIGDFIKPGITTNEIDKLVYDYHVNVQGGYPAPLNYGNPPYPKSCCTSVNHVICHGIPDDKPLKEGDILNIDLTIKRRFSWRQQPHVYRGQSFATSATPD